LPRPRDLPVKTGPLLAGTTAEVSQTFATVLKKVASGQLTLGQAQEIADLLEGRRRALETQELDSRLRSVQQLLSQDPSKPTL
jgi:hypothetical protein